jgi:hypothetical protein
LYTLASGSRVPVFDADGESLGDTYVLPAMVHVTRPRRPPGEAALGLTDVTDATYADQIKLLGAVLPDRHIELPGFVHLALLWRAEIDGPDDVSVRVGLVDADGRTAAEIVTAPVGGRYPSSAWSAGEIVRDPYSLWLTDDFPSGAYELRVGVGGVDSWTSLGRLDVTGP